MTNRDDYTNCNTRIVKDTLDLIQKEIENLKVENQSLRSADSSLKMHYEEAQAEIERLNKVYQANQQLINALNKSYFLAKSKAYKEFADLSIKRICEQVSAPTPSESYIVERCNQEIYNLLKEMAGEE